MLGDLRAVLAAAGAAALVVIGLTALAHARADSAPVPAIAPPVGRALPPGQVFRGGLAVDPAGTAAQQAASLRARGDAADASSVERIGSQPTATWLGDWYTDAQLAAKVSGVVAAAQRTGSTAVFVTYAIPGRDCGGYSAGGLTDDTYLAWNAAVAKDLRGTRSVVIVEPDALAMLTEPACAPYAASRPALIRSAVRALVADGLTVYLDAGNSRWVAPERMAPLLRAAGIAEARGFATDVANFNPIADETAYADRVSALTGGAHYVIDVSRSGADRARVIGWCNPAHAALGPDPTVADGRTHLDALLWVKPPGASDGTCNGGPRAGTWWLDGALALIRARDARA